MALILEILHPDGSRTRRRLDALPLTLGRALANDVVLDDPYVDGRHAHISADASGAIRIEDLGSVNGLLTADAGRGAEVVLRPGTEIRIGRTMLRVRDADEPVPPALVDAPAPHAAVTPPAAAILPRPVRARARRGRRAIELLTMTTRGRLLVATVAVGALTFHSWLGSFAKSGTSDAFTDFLAIAVVFAIWAGLWAVASKVVVQRVNFVAHLAVIAAVTLAGLGWTVTESWLLFLFPDVVLIEVVSFTILFVLIVALLVGHLSLASSMSRRKQVVTGAIVAGSLFAMVGLTALVEDDQFTDVPEFGGVVKPIAAGWMPASSVDDFGDVMRELKTEVDVMVEDLAAAQDQGVE